MTYPPAPAPRLALHCQSATAAQSSALRIPAYAPWKGMTTVRKLRLLRFIDWSSPWDGPAETTT